MPRNAAINDEDLQQRSHPPVFAINRDAVQKIVAEWKRLKGGYLDSILDDNGERIELPVIIVTDDFASALEESVVPIIQDQCEEAVANWIASGVDRRAGVKRQPAVLPAIPGTIKVQRSDMVRRR